MSAKSALHPITLFDYTMRVDTNSPILSIGTGASHRIFASEILSVRHFFHNLLLLQQQRRIGLHMGTFHYLLVIDVTRGCVG